MLGILLYFLLVLYRQQLLVTPAILVILNIRRLSQDSFYDIYLIPSWDRRVLAEISPDTECTVTSLVRALAQIQRSLANQRYI